MSHKRASLIFAWVLIITVIVAACNPATQAPAPTQAPSGPANQAPVVEPTQPPAPAEVVKVQYWSTAWFPSSIEGRLAIVDQFNKEYAGKIEIEYIQGGWGEGETYVQSGAAAGGGIACIVEYHTDGQLDWYRKGWSLDLRPYMTDARRALADESQWEARTFPDDGAIVSNATVLWEPSLILQYNPALLEKAGIQPATSDDPWTWEELYENAALLTLDSTGKHLGEDGFNKDDVVQWGYLAALDSEGVQENGMLFAQGAMGQGVIREENGKWGWFLTDEGARAFESYLSPVVMGIAPPESIGITGDSRLQMMGDGKVAIEMGAVYDMPQYKDNYPDAVVKAMPTPFDQGDSVFYRAGGEGMSITANCEHPAEAAEFLFWVMEPKNMASYAYPNGMVPANFAALDEEPFASDPQWEITRHYLDNGTVFVTPYNPNFVEFRDTVLSPLLMEVVNGTKTFAEVNAELATSAEEILNQ